LHISSANLISQPPFADAHGLVEELKGPFDFVFSDADKDWYKNYSGIREFLDYVKSLPNFKTTIDTTSSAGISISYKIAEK
jgi:predicted O-methyltransferase YrrM